MRINPHRPEFTKHRKRNVLGRKEIRKRKLHRKLNR